MKSKLRRIMGLLLTISLVIGLCACTGSNGASSGSTVSNGGSSESTSTAAGGDDSAISADSPYYGMGYDLTETKNVVLYVLGDAPADLDRVMEEVNSKWLLPNLNSTLDVKFLNWSDYQTKYSLVLAGGENVDLMYTASWCYYNEEVAKGAFKLLDMDFIEKFMPYTYENQPEVSWNQAKSAGEIYAVPKTQSSFTNYQLLAVRQDLIDEHGLAVPTDWNTFKAYLTELAALKSETGVTAMNTTANRNETLSLYMQTLGARGFTEGFDYFYMNPDSEELPSWEGVEYIYSSDMYLDYCLEMAELAKAGVWSSDAINDTNESQTYFENGTSGAFVWNTTIFSAGEALEDAEAGTYVGIDLTPEVKSIRGRYNADMIAIATNSKDQERAALVLDHIKSDASLNRTILGGVQGVHWDLNEDGDRIELDEAENYQWNTWAWALNRSDEPDLAGMDEREQAAIDIIVAKEIVPKSEGFTFDPSSISTELSVINSVRDEYQYSFSLGIYGDETENKVNEFVGKLKAAGLDKVTEELKTQYEAFAAENTTE